MICVLQGTKVDLVRIPRDRDEEKRLYSLARSFWEVLCDENKRAVKKFNL